MIVLKIAGAAIALVALAALLDIVRRRLTKAVTR